MYNSKHILCIKWGTRYSSEYVNKLYNMVSRHLSLPYQFHCLTDDPTGILPEINVLPISENEKEIKGWWHKVSIFKEDFYGLKGELLFIDLDMVIMNNIDSFFSYAPGAFCMVENWFRKHTGSSCVMRITIGSHPEVYENFFKNSAKVMSDYKKSGDQLFIYDQMSNVTFWPEDYVINYKTSCNYRLLPWYFLMPKKALAFISDQFGLYTKEPTHGKILAFQGKPDMHEILDKPSGKYRASPWLKKHWQ